MKIISCDNCAILLDGDKMAWPADWETEDGVDESKAAYFTDRQDWLPYVKCPCCAALIPQQ